MLDFMQIMQTIFQANTTHIKESRRFEKTAFNSINENFK